MPPDSATRLIARAHAHGVVEVHLDSDDGLNRLSPDLLAEIAAAPAAWPGARRFVLTGNQRYFSVGADLQAIAALDAAEAWPLARAGQRALDAIANSPRPFIAALAGFCLGGGLDLALACRARVCAPEAYLGHHGAKLGLVTGWGGTQRLPRLIDRARALEHLLAAQGWSAAAALEQGLAQALCPAGALLDTAAGVRLLSE
ncbi:MAG TPA: enoyl-CoA hydratase/isomerase family protein [Terriglobales bacterium]|nr:enoyl-CoA hydratase/isomerase family protein [Terriglobales bacterium]